VLTAGEKKGNIKAFKLAEISVKVRFSMIVDILTDNHLKVAVVGVVVVCGYFSSIKI